MDSLSLQEISEATLRKNQWHHKSFTPHAPVLKVFLEYLQPASIPERDALSRFGLGKTVVQRCSLISGGN